MPAFDVTTPYALEVTIECKDALLPSSFLLLLVRHLLLLVRHLLLLASLHCGSVKREAPL